MKRRITRRAFTIAGIAGLLFMAATTAQAGWLYVLSAGVLGLVVSSLFVRHRLRGIEIGRTMPRRVRQGDEIRVGLEVHNRSRRRSPLLRVEDLHPATAPTPVLVGPLPPGGSSVVETVRTAERRGIYDGGPVTAISGAPFGFVRSTRRLDVVTDTVVVPRFVELRSFPILEPSSSPMDVLHERARMGAGEEYLGVREYRPGDPRRAVHWRSTARVGQLIVREFQEEVATRLMLVLAGSDTGDPPDSAFEMLVGAAASIGAYAIQTGHPVEAVAAGPDGPMRLVEPDRMTLLDWLAGVQAVDAALDDLLASTLVPARGRSTVVLLAPTDGVAGGSIVPAVGRIQQSGSRAIAVLAQASSWGAAPEPLEPASVGARVPLRVIHRGGDLARCLAM